MRNWSSRPKKQWRKQSKGNQKWLQTLWTWVGTQTWSKSRQETAPQPQIWLLRIKVSFLLIIKIEFDHKAFEADGRRILEETQKKFIDLGIDDPDNSGMADIVEKQEKYKIQLNKIDFTYTTHLLDMPQGTAANEEELGKEDPDIEKEAAVMKELVAGIAGVMTNSALLMGDEPLLAGAEWDIFLSN